MGIEGQATGLQRTLMSWDYWRLADKLADGSGVVDTLRHVPKSFSSVEVCPACRAVLCNCHT